MVYVVFVLLLSSVIALFMAPVLTPSSYDWMAHATSESGTLKHNVITNVRQDA